MRSMFTSRPTKSPAPSKEKGVALVLAVMISAIVVAISVKASWHFDMGLTRSANRWHSQQADAYMVGLEGLVHSALKVDKEETEYDHLGEFWAMEQPPFPTDEGGYIKGVIEDAHGRLNLNLLAKKGNQKPGAPLHEKYTTSQKRFIRLLQTIELEEGEFLTEGDAVTLTDAVIDWIDPDNDVSGFGGAESDYYSSLEIPIQRANRPMISVSELMVIKGMTPQLYRGLLPYVIALNDPTAMTNINTMLPPLLRTLNSPELLVPLTIEEAEQMVEGRGAEGFESIEFFKDSDVVAMVLGAGHGNNPAVSTEDLTVNSDYFLLFGEVMVGDHTRRSNALLFRAGDKVVTLRRTDANF